MQAKSLYRGDRFRFRVGHDTQAAFRYTSGTDRRHKRLAGRMFGRVSMNVRNMRGAALIVLALAGAPAAAQAPNEDVKCLLASNLFVKNEQDAAKKQIAVFSSYYLSRPRRCAAVRRAAFGGAEGDSADDNGPDRGPDHDRLRQAAAGRDDGDPDARKVAQHDEVERLTRSLRSGLTLMRMISNSELCKRNRA